MEERCFTPYPHRGQIPEGTRAGQRNQRSVDCGKKPEAIVTEAQAGLAGQPCLLWPSFGWHCRAAETITLCSGDPPLWRRGQGQAQFPGHSPGCLCLSYVPSAVFGIWGHGREAARLGRPGEAHLEAVASHFGVRRSPEGRAAKQITGMIHWIPQHRTKQGRRAGVQS